MDPLLSLPQVSPDRLRAVPVGGHWRIRSGILEGRNYGGDWRPLHNAQRGPQNVILIKGMILVPDA